VTPLASIPSPAGVPRTQVPQDFAMLLTEAREALRLGRPDSRALWEAVAQRATEADLDDVARAELTDRQAFRHVAKQEWNEAAACARRSAELFEEAEEPGRAVARRSRAEWCGFMAAPAEDAATLPWDAFDAVLAAADALLGAERIEPEEYAIVRHSRAASALKVLMSADKESVEEARARFDAENDALLDSAIRLGALGRAAVAEGMRSGVLATEGQAEEALAAAENAVALVERAERPWILPQYLAQQGQLLNRLGRLDQAAPVLHRALALLAEWPDEDLDDLAILMELAQNRLHADDYQAAATHLTSAAARFDRRREDLAAAHARALLGQSLMRAHRTADAVAVFESLLTEEAEARLDVEQRAQTRLDFGRALMQTGEPRAAAEVFAQLADLVTDWPDQSVLTLVAGELVCSLYAARLWEQGEQAVVRALAVHETAPNPAMVCKMLRVAAEAEYENRGAPGVDRALEMLRRGDEVNEAAEEIAGRYRRWPETALNADLRVQALGGVGRNEEALTACDQAIAAWLLGGNQTIGEYAQAVQIAAIIEGDRLGRKQQAVARLSPAITRCREAGHDRAVAVLTGQADALGD
jgi:tetratricopeptide (TPR) repeat protein